VRGPAARQLRGLLERFEARDVEGVVALFAPDGILSDPHYPPPLGPTLVGHDVIRDAITWAVDMIERPRFTVLHELSGDDDAHLAAVEVITNHDLVGGAAATFTQVFVAEVGDDGLFRRVQSYTPYPPPAPP
jgi:hypothetical protein